MPVIYMTHPEHGAMPVYSDEEAARQEKSGWVRDDIAPVVSAPVDDAPKFDRAAYMRDYARKKREQAKADKERSNDNRT